MHQTIQFLKSPSNRAWVYTLYMSVYVRKAHHALNSNFAGLSFDIASVEVLPTKRGRGVFKQYLKTLTILLESNPDLRGGITNIYIESVINPRLQASLPAMGFKQANNLSCPSFYKMLEIKEHNESATDTSA